MAQVAMSRAPPRRAGRRGGEGVRLVHGCSHPRAMADEGRQLAELAVGDDEKRSIAPIADHSVEIIAEPRAARSNRRCGATRAPRQRRRAGAH